MFDLVDGHVTMFTLFASRAIAPCLWRARDRLEDARQVMVAASDPCLGPGNGNRGPFVGPKAHA